VDGVESDDLLASEAVALSNAGDSVLIVSSDKDFAQLVNDRVKILLPPPTANPKLGWRLLDENGVKEKFGVPPACIAHYLALVGDTSDNIHGLEGVGPKTAAKWLLEHKSVEGVIANAALLKPDRFQSLVIEKAEQIRLNLKLTTLNLSHPPVQVRKISPNSEELIRLLGELEMKTSLAEAKARYTQAELFE